jgi:hypothetical protein
MLINVFFFSYVIFSPASAYFMHLGVFFQIE